MQKSDKYQSNNKKIDIEAKTTDFFPPLNMAIWLVNEHKS